MKIVTVTTPAFPWNDKAYVVQTRVLKYKNPLKDFADIILKKEEAGFTHCFIYSMNNTPDSKRDVWTHVDGADSYPFFVRWCFQKIEPIDETVLGENAKKIETILRGDFTKK